MYLTRTKFTLPSRYVKAIDVHPTGSGRLHSSSEKTRSASHSKPSCLRPGQVQVPAAGEAAGAAALKANSIRRVLRVQHVKFRCRRFIVLMADRVKPGDVYGRLTVKKAVGNQKFLCVCSCGAEKIIRWRTAISCGCARSESSRRKRLPRGVAALRDLFWRYKSASARRGLEFNLTLDQFQEITSGNCFYCHRPPKNEAGSARVYGRYVYNGVDRVDNSAGYTRENTVSCCEVCNRAKGTMGQAEFLAWIQFIREG